MRVIVRLFNKLIRLWTSRWKLRNEYLKNNMIWFRFFKLFERKILKIDYSCIKFFTCIMFICKIRNCGSPLHDSCSQEPASQTSNPNELQNIFIHFFITPRYSKSKCTILNSKREPSSTDKPVRILLWMNDYVIRWLNPYIT